MVRNYLYNIGYISYISSLPKFLLYRQNIDTPFHLKDEQTQNDSQHCLRSPKKQRGFFTPYFFITFSCFLNQIRPMIFINLKNIENRDMANTILTATLKKMCKNYFEQIVVFTVLINNLINQLTLYLIAYFKSL